MDDSFEHIIKDKLTNPPEFNFNEKPYIIAKSRLEYDRKLRKWGLVALIAFLLLMGLTLLLSRLWYQNKLKDITKNNQLISENRIRNNSILKDIDTVFKEKIVFIHDTLYKTILVYENNVQENAKTNPVINYIPGFRNFVFGNNNILNSRNLYTNKLYNLNRKPYTLLNTEYFHDKYNNNLDINGAKSATNVSPIQLSDWKNIRRGEIVKLPIILKTVKYNKKIGITKEHLYNKWLEELAANRSKEKKTFKYKLNKFFTGFSISAYEIEYGAGGISSLVFDSPNIGFYTGLDGKFLFKNKFKFTIGLKRSIFKSEYNAFDISEDDFPEKPNTGDIFDALYAENSYWLVPLGVEYHLYKEKRIYPYFGIGWAMKFNISNSFQYEFHDINTYEEYKIEKTIDESAELNNYWLKMGINYDFNHALGSSLDITYYKGNNNELLRYNRLKALALSLNLHYRF